MEEKLYDAFCPKCGACGGVIALGYITASWKTDDWTKEGLPVNEDEEQHDSFLWDENPYGCIICQKKFDKPILIPKEG